MSESEFDKEQNAAEGAGLTTDFAQAEAEASVEGETENRDSENGGAAENAQEKAEERKPFADAVEWANCLTFALSAMLLLSLFFFREITISGTSMCNTLQNGDCVLATNFFYEPSFGDIVVVQADRLVNKNNNQYGEPIVKRIIGVEGDTIVFDFEKGEVYRNGELLEEDYIAESTTVKHMGWVQSGEECVVPENCVFVLGDNRNVSHDSRDLSAIGYVDKNLIMGKVFLRLFPISDFRWL